MKINLRFLPEVYKRDKSYQELRDDPELDRRSITFHLRALPPAEDAAIHLIILVPVVVSNWELAPHSGHRHQTSVPVLHLLVSVVTNDLNYSNFVFISDTFVCIFTKEW